jgi:tetratricopeptide (TPR) repeat protein
MIGDLAGAINDLDLAIAIDPRSSLAYNNRGRARQLQGDLAAAVADYSRAIAIDPTNAFAYANRGLTRLQGGNAAQAESDFKRCLALEPTLKPSLEWHISQMKKGKKE